MQMLAWLCLGNLVYCGWVAMRQKDFNWLVGYSSVAHMGFAFLGIASLNLIGVTGAVLVMIAHGFLAALTFGLSGYIYQQTGTLADGPTRRLAAPVAVHRRGADDGGVRRLRPAGLRQFRRRSHGPLRRLDGFPHVTILACWGALIIGAVYMLRAMRDILHGPLPEKWAGVADAPHLWRKLPFILLLAGLLVFGCFPALAGRQDPAERRADRHECVHRRASATIAPAANGRTQCGSAGGAATR